MSAQGLRLGVATNDSEASARRHVEALGLLLISNSLSAMIPAMAASRSPAWCSPSHAISASSPVEVAMVGDSIHDLHAARAAGALAVAVLTGPATREELAPHADHLVDDIGALPAFFAELAARG